MQTLYTTLTSRSMNRLLKFVHQKTFIMFTFLSELSKTFFAMIVKVGTCTSV